MINQVLELSSSKLTPIQQQRYDFLNSMYGEHAADIVRNIYGKGKYSWNTFLEKMDAVEQAKAHIKEYYKSLYDTFELYEVYTGGNIIGKVNEARRDMGLLPYTEKIKLQCEHDFFLVFVVKDHYEAKLVDGIEKKELVGYVPVAKVLMPD
jgi:hypothetical protein